MRVLVEPRPDGATRYMVLAESDDSASSTTSMVDCVDVSADGRRFGWLTPPTCDGMRAILSWLVASGATSIGCAKGV